MFDTVKTIIMAGGYVLDDMIRRVKRLYAMGDLTDTEMDELLALACEHADQDLMLPDLASRVGSLETRVAAVEQRMDGLEQTGGETAGTPVEPEAPADQWPQWTRPTSKDTQYDKGDQVTYDGRHWVCVKNNVSASPDEDPRSWTLTEGA